MNTKLKAHVEERKSLRALVFGDSVENAMHNGADFIGHLYTSWREAAKVKIASEQTIGMPQIERVTYVPGGTPHVVIDYDLITADVEYPRHDVVEFDLSER